MPTFFICLIIVIQGLERSVKKNFRGMFLAVTEGFFKAQTNYTHFCLEKFKSKVPVGPP